MSVSTWTAAPTLQEVLQRQQDFVFGSLCCINVCLTFTVLLHFQVDIDMKLRSCRVSCESTPPFRADPPSVYRTLQTHLDQMDTNQRRTAAAENIPHVKLRPVDGPAPSRDYSTIPTVRRELLTQFEDIGQNQVVLEELEDSEDVRVLKTAEPE